MSYTAIGAAVNLASRLEGLNKHLGTDILVSESTKLLAGDRFMFRFAGRVMPKGTAHSCGVYELLGTCPDSTEEYARFAVRPQDKTKVLQWEKALEALLARDFNQAEKLLINHLDTNGPDRLADYYLKLTREFLAHPPKKDWQGEIRFNVK